MQSSQGASIAGQSTSLFSSHCKYSAICNTARILTREEPMPYPFDHILPSLQSFGLWTYWIIGIFAMLEAIVLTGIIVPGTLVVIAGGMLAQRGTVDIVDLVWFVAAGAAIGGEVSFHFGRLAAGGMRGISVFRRSTHAHRATALLDRYDGAAIFAGRFFGPHAAFVPFSAALGGMPHRRFAIWNLASAIPYAAILQVGGYIMGRIIGTLGAAAPRMLAFAGLALFVLGFLWLIAARIRHAMPMLAQIAASVGQGVSQNGIFRSLITRHPRIARFLTARFGTERFLGLTLTVLSALLIYIIGVWADSIFDFLGTQAAVTSDTRIANILYAMRDPQLIAMFGWVTQVGGRHGVIAMLIGVSAALLVLRRYDLFTGLWIAAVGNQLTVTLLKALFARPRSDLGYYVETSGSFPSGHAAAAVAVWALLFYLAWRMRVMSALVACFGAVTLVFLIGLSRIYLVEHYLSDVLNGYLVGAIWLILAVAFCEWRRPSVRQASTKAQGWASTAIVITALMMTGYLAFSTANMLKETPEPTLQIAQNPATLLTTKDIATTTETLTGDARQPLNLIVTVPDTTLLTTAIQDAGWVEAPRPSILKLASAFIDDWTGQELPMPLVIPTFWGEQPSKLAFALARSDLPDDTRLHARFWDSRYRTVEGDVILVGTLTREDPLEWAVSDNAATQAPANANAALDQLADQLRANDLQVTTLP